MIPPSLARLIEKWRADTYGIVELAEDCDASVKCCHEQCADELSAALQSMTVEEPVAIVDDPRCVTQTIKLPPPVLTDEMCEAFADALGKHLDVITEDDGKPYDRVYLQAVWNDIWSVSSAHRKEPRMATDPQRGRAGFAERRSVGQLYSRANRASILGVKIMSYELTSSWLPIETAPKDGRPIMTFRPKMKPQYQYEVDWWNPEPINGGPGWYRSYPDLQPTHWRPLPSAPL